VDAVGGRGEGDGAGEARNLVAVCFVFVVPAVLAVFAVFAAIASSTVRALSIRGPQATITTSPVRARLEALLNRCLLLLL
jgi:hypothetical protein